jgi:hypothetical protein
MEGKERGPGHKSFALGSRCAIRTVLLVSHILRLRDGQNAALEQVRESRDNSLAHYVIAPTTECTNVQMILQFYKFIDYIRVTVHKPEAIRNSQISQAIVLYLILIYLIFSARQGPHHLVTMSPPSASFHQSSRTYPEPPAGAWRHMCRPHPRSRSR